MEYHPIEPSKFAWQLHIDGNGHRNEVPETCGDCLIRVTNENGVVEHKVLFFSTVDDHFIDAFGDEVDFDPEPDETIEFIQLEKLVSSDS